jgi:3-phenylpropionate/trans-cinnamate dioxygenase ferredoxin reductase subunit
MAHAKCTLTVNGTPIQASVGETLVDAALGGRIVLPHDCCSGQCETCRITVISGDVDDFDSKEKNTVLGCIATLNGDAEIEFDPVPIARNTRSTVESVKEIAPELLEVRVRVSKPVPWLPGQYVKLRFSGFPVRDYSPTFPFDLNLEEEVLVFHIRVYPNSRVSANLGTTIRAGHRVNVGGPYGNAYLRRQRDPLMLLSTGTGFAPLWAIAVSALKRQQTDIQIIAGARGQDDLYMREAIDWLTAQGIDARLTAADGDGKTVFTQRPSELIGPLNENYQVYAAGAPSHVDAVRDAALAANATFYADPFYEAEQKWQWRDLIGRRFSRLRALTDVAASL